MVDMIVFGASGGIWQSIKDEFGGCCLFAPPHFSADLTKPDSVKQYIDIVSDHLNERVIMLNLAGISFDGLCHTLNMDSWGAVLDTNLTGSFVACKHVIPLMRERQWGRIILASSVVAQTGVHGTCAYSSSKAGLFGLTRTLAAENATKGITVNCLALGYFDAGMIRVLSQKMRENVVESIPMKRLGDPRNIAAAIKFLIDADYVTGTTININGGLV
jgi:NAD(P)-dependent dehydrogenase (short-subunit alcohol dehydrogenase family)